MNKKEFKRAMLCGLGRCVLACRNDPERYRAEVLWGCTNQLAYDAQCEGSRAWFLHELVSCYPDITPFREALTAALRRKSTWGWRLLQIQELLIYMADGGDGEAEKALWDRYEQSYSLLRARKRLPDHYFYLIDDFEFLASDLCRNEEDTLRILSDIGRLICENPIYDALDFVQLHSRLTEWGRKRAAVRRRYGKKDGHAAHFFAELERLQREREALYEESSEKNEQRRQRSPFLFSKNAEAFRLRAEEYLNETDAEKRAELLRTFRWRRPFPFEPDPIINDALSAHEPLRDAAWDALGIIRSPKVREFALNELEAGADKLIPLLIMNYEDEDRALIEKLLAGALADKEGDDIIHSIGLSLSYQREAGFKAPAWILHWFYENDRCSCCREDIVRELGRRRLLTDEMLRECVFDSNDDIRKYAEKMLRKRAADQG